MYCFSWFVLILCAVAQSDAQCNTVGLYCKDCAHLAACVNGNVVDIATCSATDVCSNNACAPQSSTNICQSSSQSFQCTAIGMFPDPFNCKKYYVCVDENLQSGNFPDAHSCPTGYAYNPRTTYCDVKISADDRCPSTPPVPACKNPLQNGALTANPTIYYVCVTTSDQVSVLYPKLYLCPNGKRYSGNFNCI